VNVEISRRRAENLCGHRVPVESDKHEEDELL